MRKPLFLKRVVVTAQSRQVRYKEKMTRQYLILCRKRLVANAPGPMTEVMAFVVVQVAAGIYIALRSGGFELHRAEYRQRIPPAVSTPSH